MKKKIMKASTALSLVLAASLVFAVPAQAATTADITAQNAKLQEAQKAYNQQVADANKAAVEASVAAKVAIQKTALDASNAAAAAAKIKNADIAAANKAAVEANNAAKVAAQKAALDASNAAAAAAKIKNEEIAAANRAAVVASLAAKTAAQKAAMK